MYGGVCLCVVVCVSVYVWVCLWMGMCVSVCLCGCSCGDVEGVSVWSGVENREYQCVVSFLNGIPQDALAKVSFRSKAYTRAVMHFETFIREKKQNIQDHLTFLQVSRVLPSSFVHTDKIKYIFMVLKAVFE